MVGDSYAECLIIANIFPMVWVDSQHLLTFHFQTLHCTIMTNKKLHQFNLRNNELIDECQVLEDISHLLYDCPLSFALWEELLNWLSLVKNKAKNLDRKSIILGSKDNDILINTLILLTKYELYKKKWKCHLKRVFLRQMRVNIYVGTINNNLPKVLGKWCPIHNTLIAMQ